MNNLWINIKIRNNSKQNKNQILIIIPADDYENEMLQTKKKWIKFPTE